MDSPRPLPSVVLEESPLMNRSVSSSGLMLICCLEMFFTDTVIKPSRFFISM